MAQNYTEQLRKDNVRDAIYEDLQNNCEVLRTSWSGNAFPANPKVGQPCYRVDEDKLYYWDGYKWSQKGGGGSAELKTMELAAATSERVSITLEGARCLDKNMMFVFVDKIAQDPSTYSMNDDGTVVNFNPAIPANAAVTLRWFDTDVGTFDTAIFASDAEFEAGELTNKAPNVKQVHSLSDQIQTSNANYVKSELQSNLLNYTTNRILEIPQDIKLELNNGTLTLKAGSKVYVPNGVGTFNAVTITSDVSTVRTDSQDCIAWYNTDAGTIELFPSVLFYSGTTAPSGYQFMFWYDITNNKCKVTSNSGSTWVEGKSFPICVVSTDGTKISAIKQVFNGFGYIGSTLFLLPGVKTVVPDGRNEDGTCKNKAPSTVASVKTETISRADTAYMFTNSVSSVIATHHYVCSKTKPTVTETTLWYNPETNLSSQVLSDGTVMTPYYEIPIAKFTSDSTGKITSFDPFTVDSIVNSNEFYQLKDKAVTTDSAQTISGVKTFTGGTLKANTPLLLKQNNANEGGQIDFERSNNSVLKQNPYIDLFINTIRFIGVNSNNTTNSTLQVDLENNLVLVPTPATTANDTQVATTAWVNSKIQLVNELPANPVAGVLYCIPEA